MMDVERTYMLARRGPCVPRPFSDATECSLLGGGGRQQGWGSAGGRVGAGGRVKGVEHGESSAGALDIFA